MEYCTCIHRPFCSPTGAPGQDPLPVLLVELGDFTLARFARHFATACLSLICFARSLSIALSSQGSPMQPSLCSTLQSLQFKFCHSILFDITEKLAPVPSSPLMGMGGLTSTWALVQRKGSEQRCRKMSMSLPMPGCHQEMTE